MITADSLLLRQEAYGLSGRLFIALLDCADDARRARLQRVQRRAEQRYWRRHEQECPPGNQTPAWFRENAKPGY